MGLQQLLRKQTVSVPSLASSESNKLGAQGSAETTYNTSNRISTTKTNNNNQTLTKSKKKNFGRSKKWKWFEARKTQYGSKEAPTRRMSWEEEDSLPLVRSPKRISSTATDASNASSLFSASRSTTVSFSDVVDVNEIIPLGVMASSPDQIWYRQEDYVAIKARIRLIVDYVEADKREKQPEQDQQDQQTPPPPPPPLQDHDTPPTPQARKRKLCTRGLEAILNGPSTLKYEAWQCIMIEQKLQQEEGIYDEESMAAAYQEVSKSSVKEARRRALNDQKEADIYLGR